jgi:mono/diheme cytochrome c family protein
MPAFKDVLSEDQRWEIILYIANGVRTDEITPMRACPGTVRFAGPNT